ncbi:MAG: DUF2169 domain-containing protein [Polyangiaceae bacterium]
MKIKNLTPFPLVTKVTSRRPPRPEMAVIVRAAYALAPTGELSLPETPEVGPTFLAQGFLSSETYREEDEERTGECLYPGDLADFKPRGEVMLRGTCHTPFGKPLTECPVRFEVGSFSKLLRVSGRRFWSDDGAGAVMSEAAPFTKMPVDYAHAFGGAGNAHNPVGLGSSGRELPNVEHAGNVIRKRRDDPGPASFAPVSPSWPLRAAKLGKDYGPRWRKERWPFHAEDLDWSHFQAAPPDQHLEKYLRGDERVVFQNLHPEAPVIETRLPGLRVRAFVKDTGDRFREVAMVLDTLYADLDESRIYLTYRGLDPVGEIDLSDVATVLLASEPLTTAPLPEKHYRERMLAFEADPLEIKDRIPADLLEKQAALGKHAKDRAEGKLPERPPAPDPLTAAVRAQLDEMPVPSEAANDIEQQMSAAVAQLLGQKAPDKDMAAEVSAAAATLEKASPKARRPAVSLRTEGPPPAWAGKAFAQAQQELERGKATLAAQKAPGEGAAKLAASVAELEAQIEELKSNPFFARLAERPPETDPGREKDLSGQDYEGRDLSGLDLSRSNFRDANLAYTNLRGARLTGAILDGAVLVQADLAGADLTGADLTLANLTAAKAQGASFARATLDRAFFHEADLEGASFEGARGQFTFFPNAQMRGSKARELSLEDAFFRKVDCSGADFAGATLLRCHFIEACARGASFARATLTASSFLGADLTRANLSAASGDRTAWLKARLDEANAARAVMRGAFFIEASLVRAQFRRAILKESRFLKARLEGADFTESSLFSADLSRCAVARAIFRGANLYDAKLLGAHGEGTDFSGANLTRALREGL